MTWKVTYEDAVIMSERLVKNDVYTSVNRGYDSEAHDTRNLDTEEITREISEALRKT